MVFILFVDKKCEVIAIDVNIIGGLVPELIFEFVGENDVVKAAFNDVKGLTEVAVVVVVVMVVVVLDIILTGLINSERKTLNQMGTLTAKKPSQAFTSVGFDI